MGAKRGPWSQHEDATLLELVDTQGAHNWVRISQFIRTRSPKQCRERYHQNLKPSLSHEPITPEEGELIERLVSEMGKRWAEIARRLPGRSDNAVKNWWNGGMNRRRRIVVRREGSVRGAPEPLSFARPAPAPRPDRHILVPTSRRRIEAPLISPVHSEPDSVGEAPSLVSDSSSHFSISSPNAITHQHYHSRYLPLPETPLSDLWRLGTNGAGTSSGNTYPNRISSSTSDRSPPVWSHTEVPKSPHHPPSSYQRLQQFADVATRSVIAAHPDVQRRQQSQYPLPSFKDFFDNAEGPRTPLHAASNSRDPAISQHCQSEGQQTRDNIPRSDYTATTEDSYRPHVRYTDALPLQQAPSVQGAAVHPLGPGPQRFGSNHTDSSNPLLPREKRSATDAWLSLPSPETKQQKMTLSSILD